MTRSIFLCLLALTALACGIETAPGPGQNVTAGDGSVNDSGLDAEAGASSTSGGTGGESGTTGGSGTGGESGTTGGESGTTGGEGGVTGGEGGTAGNAPCDADNDCSAAVPQCNLTSGLCARCSSNAACEDRDGKTHCDATPGSPTRGQCIECIADTHCKERGKGQCLEGSCVECNEHSDCFASKPQCSDDGACEACTDSDACEGRDGKTQCETDAGAAKPGQCVECTDNDHCENPTPQCNGNVCGDCTGEEACSERAGTEHCNTREGLETSGQCVQCTGATEAEECEGKSCKQATGECTGTDVHMTNPCGACEADSECVANTKCVAHEREETNLGSFCFYADPAGGCADVNALARPYSVPLNGTSIDGDAATYCLPDTSCAALEDATIFMMSPGAKPCANDTECGVGNADVDGAYCIPSTFSVESAREKCSFACDDSSDCPSTGFTNCPDDGLKFCRP